jgi:hypothetical protein
MVPIPAVAVILKRHPKSGRWEGSRASAQLPFLELRRGNFLKRGETV